MTFENIIGYIFILLILCIIPFSWYLAKKEVAWQKEQDKKRSKYIKNMDV
jgi:hypothetical protein